VRKELFRCKGSIAGEAACWSVGTSVHANSRACLDLQLTYTKLFLFVGWHSREGHKKAKG